MSFFPARVGKAAARKSGTCSARQCDEFTEEGVPNAYYDTDSRLLWRGDQLNRPKKEELPWRERYVPSCYNGQTHVIDPTLVVQSMAWDDKGNPIFPTHYYTIDQARKLLRENTVYFSGGLKFYHHVAHAYFPISDILMRYPLLALPDPAPPYLLESLFMTQVLNQ